MGNIVKVNCETKEIIEREMTIKEKELYDSMLADGENFAQTLSEKFVVKESALAKLQALGLTQEEIQAIIS
jgi:hypothetical protein